MKMIPWTKVLILASSITLGVACSDSNGSDTPAATTTPANDSANTGTGTAVTGDSTTSAGNGATPAAAVSCEDSWVLYVKARPAGFSVGYKITTQNTSADGTVIPSADTSYEDTVVASDDTHVLSKHTVTVQGLAQPISSNVDLTKLQWIAACKQGSTAVAGLPTTPDVSFEILEQGPASIQVAAGTFATDHIKGKTSANDSESGTTFESWTLQDGSGILVKAVTSTTSDIAGALTVTNVTIELTKLSSTKK